MIENVNLYLFFNDLLLLHASRANLSLLLSNKQQISMADMDCNQSLFSEYKDCESNASEDEMVKSTVKYVYLDKFVKHSSLDFHVS